MSKFRFTAEIKIREANPYVLVSADLANKIKSDWKKPLPVLIQVNGEPKPPWHINMMPVGNGDFYLYLHGDVRKASNTKVGDRVTVDISFDTNYHNGPIHSMPSWFKSALDKNQKAKKNWEALIPSRQKEILRYFSWLKSEDAKERNLVKVMSILNGETGRFMARSWDKGK